MNALKYVGLPLLAMGGFLIVLLYGWGRQDRADCLEWKQEATYTPAYWITSAQKEQCDYWGVDVGAPVE